MRLIGNAHLVAGGKEMVSGVFELLEGHGIKTLGNPDIYLREYLHFGIDEARELRSRASSRAIAGEHRIFIVVCAVMTVEAQNALLKTLEEPPAEAVFFFVVPSPETLLPTLRSRFQNLPLGGGVPGAGGIDAGKFVSASPAERISMLEPLIEKDEDEERDVGAIISFLSSLERMMGHNKTINSEGLKAVYRARKYINDKGASVKSLLQQVALLVPRSVK